MIFLITFSLYAPSGAFFYGRFSGGCAALTHPTPNTRFIFLVGRVSAAHPPFSLKLHLAPWTPVKRPRRQRRLLDNPPAAAAFFPGAVKHLEAKQRAVMLILIHRAARLV